MHKKATYVEGFVLIVPKKNVVRYKKMAKQGAALWKKHGALSYRECMMDDANAHFITLTFPKLTKAKPDDTIWFSYIEFESKKHRNVVNKKVMSDPSLNDMDMNNMPFEMKKMSSAGFKIIVSN